MPLPNPRPSETEQDWMSRCMGDDEMQTEFPDQKQRTAVCAQKWRDKGTRATEEHERRYLPACELRVAVGDDGVKRLVGYPAVFNVLSSPIQSPFGLFRERIRPGAFTRSLSKGIDVHATIEHDGGITTLGRLKSGTLTLTEDEKGLFAEIVPPNTMAGRDVVELVNRGDLDNMSFAFNHATDDWAMEDGEEIRTLIEVDVHDVSIVAQGAYPDTTIAVRSREAWKAGLGSADAAAEKAKDASESESTIERLKRMDLTYAAERVKSGSRWGRQEK